MSGADVLRELQRRVERLHGTSDTPDVRAFVVGDEARCAIPGARAEVPEQLFVREDPDDPEELELALYLAPAIVRALAQDDPHRRLHGGNLLEFWVALEGVSHFVLVAARACARRPVTALELEIQAEVDKFALTWMLLGEQGARPELAARQVFGRLFAPYVLHAPMPADEVDRYHVATRVARRFCSRLTRAFAADRDSARVAAAVRRFVQLEVGEKLRAA